MAKKNYECEECGAAVYLSMKHCSECGSRLYIDPQRFVCNLAVVTAKTEKLPREEREYKLQYETPFNEIDELLNARHKYDSLGINEQNSLIYGSHLVYVSYRLNSLKNGRLKVEDAYQFVKVGVRRKWFKNYPVYFFMWNKDFPKYIKIVG